jgi:hypothetical protein
MFHLLLVNTETGQTVVLDTGFESQREVVAAIEEWWKVEKPLEAPYVYAYLRW